MTSGLDGQEKDAEEFAALRIMEDQVVVGANSFRFDQVFHGGFSQEQLYTTFIQPLVNDTVGLIQWAPGFSIEVRLE